MAAAPDALVDGGIVDWPSRFMPSHLACTMHAGVHVHSRRQDDIGRRLSNVSLPWPIHARDHLTISRRLADVRGSTRPASPPTRPTVARQSSPLRWFSSSPGSPTAGHVGPSFFIVGQVFVCSSLAPVRQQPVLSLFFFLFFFTKNGEIDRDHAVTKITDGYGGPRGGIRGPVSKWLFGTVTFSRARRGSLPD